VCQQRSRIPGSMHWKAASSFCPHKELGNKQLTYHLNLLFIDHVCLLLRVPLRPCKFWTSLRTRPVCKPWGTLLETELIARWKLGRPYAAGQRVWSSCGRQSPAISCILFWVGCCGQYSSSLTSELAQIALVANEWVAGVYSISCSVCTNIRVDKSVCSAGSCFVAYSPMPSGPLGPPIADLRSKVNSYYSDCVVPDRRKNVRARSKRAFKCEELVGHCFLPPHGLPDFSGRKLLLLSCRRKAALKRASD
jgi:hypothetical protein